MAKYKLFSEPGHIKDEGIYTAYGIEVFQGKQSICKISDISADRDKTAALVSRFNSEELSPNQLDEAIENFLYDFEV